MQSSWRDQLLLTWFLPIVLWEQSMFPLARDSSIRTELGLQDKSSFTQSIWAFLGAGWGSCWGGVCCFFGSSPSQWGDKAALLWGAGVYPSITSPKSPISFRLWSQEVCHCSEKSQQHSFQKWRTETSSATTQHTRANMPQKVSKAELETTPTHLEMCRHYTIKSVWNTRKSKDRRQWEEQNNLLSSMP